MAAKKSPTPVAQGAGFYCYIGPSVGGVIRHGEVFRGGRDEALKAAAEAVEKLPPMKSLLVPGESLAGTWQKVSQPGNALYAACGKVRELAKELAKGVKDNA